VTPAAWTAVVTAAGQATRFRPFSDPGRVVGIRQRPDPATVRVPLAVVSRLILRPSIFDLLVPTERADGEIDLGVAVGELARTAEVRVHRITGRWVSVDEPRRYLAALQTYWQIHTEPSAHQ
jgi:UTP--glucose-1-phosphate uridylyltransferase